MPCCAFARLLRWIKTTVAGTGVMKAGDSTENIDRRPGIVVDRATSPIWLWATTEKVSQLAQKISLSGIGATTPCGLCSASGFIDGDVYVPGNAPDDLHSHPHQFTQATAFKTGDARVLPDSGYAPASDNYARA